MKIGGTPEAMARKRAFGQAGAIRSRKVDDIRPRRDRIDDQKLGAGFGRTRLGLGQGLDGPDADGAARIFFQRRGDGSRDAHRILRREER